MTLPLTTTALLNPVERPEKHSYRISDTPYKFVVTVPSAAPDLWEAYLDGALQSYRSHGVEAALEFDTIRSGATTGLFFVAMDGEGNVVAGVRVQGPYGRADESHATLEWAGHAGEAEVWKMITDRLPFGVLEMKGAWISDRALGKSVLATAIARCALIAMAMLDAQFVMATAAEYVLSQWTASGAVLAASVPSAPYPTPQYRTRMVWMDRRTFATHADPAQVPRMLNELMELTSNVNWNTGSRHLQSVGS